MVCKYLYKFKISDAAHIFNFVERKYSKSHWLKVKAGKKREVKIKYKCFLVRVISLWKHL